MHRMGSCISAHGSVAGGQMQDSHCRFGQVGCRTNEGGGAWKTSAGVNRRKSQFRAGGG